MKNLDQLDTGLWGVGIVSTDEETDRRYRNEKDPDRNASALSADGMPRGLPEEGRTGGEEGCCPGSHRAGGLVGRGGAGAGAPGVPGEGRADAGGDE